jgi:hypothetical protein
MHPLCGKPLQQLIMHTKIKQQTQKKTLKNKIKFNLK